MATVINIEDFLKFDQQFAYYNSLKLQDIELHKDGKPIGIPEDFVKQWSYIGLNTIDFIRSCSCQHSVGIMQSNEDDMQNFHGS